MKLLRHHDPMTSEPLTAGQVAPAGVYRRIGTNIQVTLRAEGHLPGSLDGNVACYELVENTWHQHTMSYGKGLV